MSLAGRCEVCEVEPLWTLLRRGDAVISWACAEHLSEVALRLQRRQSTEVTELVVKYRPTSLQHAELDRAFADILADPPVTP